MPADDTRKLKQQIEVLQEEVVGLETENKELKARLGDPGAYETGGQSGTSASPETDSSVQNMIKTTMASPETSGVCGADLTWYYQNGVMVISGTGKMADYHYNWGWGDEEGVDSPWWEIREKVGWLIVDKGATSIGNYAFGGLQSMSKAILADTVETIGEGAFGKCENLLEITLPDKVKTIETYTFYECTNLKGIRFPSALETIGENAFEGCKNLQEITLPNALEAIGERAFNGCENLTKVILPDALKSIERGAFDGCDNMKEVTLPNTLEYIGDYPLCGREYQEEITVPDSLKSIGILYGNCQTLNVSNNITSIKDINGDWQMLKMSDNIKYIGWIGSEDETARIVYKGTTYTIDEFEKIMKELEELMEELDD